MRATRFSNSDNTDSRTRVFNALVWNHRISRVRLAEKLGLTRAAVGVVVDDLMARGLVRRNGTEASSGGRRAVILEVDPDAAVAVGASMNDYSWSVVATNLEAEVITRKTVLMRNHSPEAAVDAICEGYAAIAPHLAERFVLPALGIGSPGLVDTHTGTIVQAVDLNWHNIRLGEMVRERLGLEIFMVNRSKVGALAEFWCTRERGAVRDLVFVSIGTGVAAGIIQDGELVLGATSSAGELGHLTVVPNGPVCGCGNRGCLQTVVNEDAILSRARTLQERTAPDEKRFVDALSVVRAADTGNPVARHVVEETAEYLSTALGGMVNLLNPELIILGGPVPDSGTLLLEETRRRIGNHCMHHNLEDLEIRRSSFGGDSSAIGAAVLVIKRATDFFFP